MIRVRKPPGGFGPVPFAGGATGSRVGLAGGPAAIGWWAGGARIGIAASGLTAGRRTARSDDLGPDDLFPVLAESWWCEREPERSFGFCSAGSSCRPFDSEGFRL